ncbi:DUF2076 domain-containing protein [Pseudomonas putida]|uniref:DUF2076 domain-containing protein n=1 Tax=Pseudomonas putida TaxID=303 RepID=UPI002363CD39|nr:DUF2076 domain-containing protein [Pseudomonas putida]MDD2055244.1 DUF2076 domain-containing protein [Pseudomonas putida]
MNHEEQTLIDGLFSRLQQAQAQPGPRDAEAEARIREHLLRQPTAGYYMTQAILVQEAALKQLDEQNRQLQAQLQQAQADLQQARSQGSPAPSSGGGGFLSSIFGGGNREPQPAAPAPSASGGGWREPVRPAANAPAQNFNAQPGYASQPPQQPPAAAGSGFLGGALKTAAGVAGGVMLAQGLSSLFSHNQQPAVVEEIIKEEPAPLSDSGGGWNDQPRMANNDSWGGSDQAGLSDADFSNDDAGFFSDDDTYV